MDASAPRRIVAPPPAAPGGAPADVAQLGPLLDQLVAHALHTWPDRSGGAGLTIFPESTASGCGNAREDDGVDDAAVRAMLRRVCAVARTEGMRSEQLLVRLKTAWAAVPEAHRTRRADDADVLARVVTRCIDAYYAPVHPPVVSPTPAAPGTSALAPRTREPALRVVVVDDTPSLRRMLTRLLVCAGHTVVGEAATAADAVTQVAALAPDVVLLDLHLPDGLGTDVAGRLTARTSIALPPPAVVLCTGAADAMSDIDFSVSGVFAVLLKPVSMANLDRVVREAACARAGMRPNASHDTPLGLDARTSHASTRHP